MSKHLIAFVMISFLPGLGFCETDTKPLMLGNFSQGMLDDWEQVEFNGNTQYELVPGSGSEKVLKATSQQSASGLFKKMDVDIKKYPYINWRWKLEKALPQQEEHLKSGDDYAARLYVVVSDGWFFWQTKALNYVWSSQNAPAESWPNAYAPDNTLMMPLRKRNDSVGVWYEEKRNVYQDLKAWLGKSFDKVEAIAIMTDADDSELEAQAMYGDIYFTAQ